MNKPVLLTLFIALILVGCGQQSIPPLTRTPTKTAQTSTSTSIPSATATLKPSPTSAPISTPTYTPTPRATSTPAAISPANFGGLLRESEYPLPVRGILRSAYWSADGKSVLAITDIGVEVLSSDTLEPIQRYPGMSPITELDGNEWFVRAEGQRKILNMDGDRLELLPVDKAIDEQGFDVLARNAETAARKTGDDEVEIVSLRTGDRQLFNIKDAGYQLKFLRLMALSPDGKMLVIEDTYWSNLYFVDLETLEVAYTLNRVYDPPVFSPDGQTLLTIDNGGIKVIKARNGIQTNRFSDGFIIRPTPRSYIVYRAVAYDYYPDSQRVGVVYCIENEKCELYIWSMETGQPETIIKDLPLGTNWLDFSPDGHGFLTISRDGFLSTWSLESQGLLAQSQPYDRARAVVSMDGRLAAAPRGSQIEIFDLETGEPSMKLGDYPAELSLMVDGITQDTVLVAGFDYQTGAFVDLWDVSSGELVRKFKPLDYPNTYSNDPYCKLAIAGKRIACGATPLQIFDMYSGELLYSHKSSEGTLVWAMSPDGNTLASCTVVYEQDTYDAIPGDRIFLLDLSASTPVISNVLEASEGGICSPMEYSPDGQYLASQSGFIWQLDQPHLVASFSKQADEPISFSPDGTVLVAGKRLIETKSGEELATLSVKGSVERLGFDEHGYRLVLVTDQGVEIWKVSGEWQPGDSQQPGPIAIAWSPHPTPKLYDDFSGESLNVHMWEAPESSSSSAHRYSQSDGMLTMRSENSGEMSGLDLHLAQPLRRRIDQVTTYEARLKVASESQGVGFAKIQVFADIPGQSWWTQCRLGNELIPERMSFICDVGSIQNGNVTLEHMTAQTKVEFDRWYLVRIEFNPDTGGIQYYLDGQLVETYLPSNAEDLLIRSFIPSVGVWASTSSTRLVVNFDDVRITASR